MKKIIYKKGQKFGSVTFVEEVSPKKSKFICECGNEFTAAMPKIKFGKTKSCGCLKKKITGARFRTHGFTQTKLYSIWKHIKARCFNPKSIDYVRYGGRGIAMQENWINDFIAFKNYAETIENYSIFLLNEAKMSMDRIDVNGGYFEGNIRFADATIQARNRGIQKNNTSGYIGVSFIKALDKYLASITVNKKVIRIGYDKCPKKASEIRMNYILENNLKAFN
jgi:hypothetical protein